MAIQKDYLLSRNHHFSSLYAVCEQIQHNEQEKIEKENDRSELGGKTRQLALIEEMNSVKDQLQALKRRIASVDQPRQGGCYNDHQQVAQWNVHNKTQIVHKKLRDIQVAEFFNLQKLAHVVPELDQKRQR